MPPEKDGNPLETLRTAMPKPGFEALGDDSFAFHVPDQGISLTADRVRRERHELIAEFAARCTRPGARVVNGSALSIADLNLSSARARQERAKLLSARANTQDVDWAGLVEGFAQLVIRAYREGQPATDLRLLERPGPDDTFHVEGFRLPRRHAAILFGDGGTAKSYTALYLAGKLAERGMGVALFDWELAGEDHRDRLERLFPEGMPRIVYARCERPLVAEVDRLKRIVREEQIEYAVFDSVAFACDGAPESAEVAGAYFRAVRQIGVGSLHIAHISKAEGADRKPFGSTFWHNGARSTWYVKLAESTAETGRLILGFFHRKSNLGRLQPPLGFEVVFEDGTTEFRRTGVEDHPDMSGQLSVRQRLVALLRHGAKTPAALAEELDERPDTVRRTLRRHRETFLHLGNDRYGLLSGV